MTGIDAVLEYVRQIFLEQQELKKYNETVIRSILRSYNNEYEQCMENIGAIVRQNVTQIRREE